MKYPFIVNYKKKEYKVKFNYQGKYDGRKETIAYITEPYKEGQKKIIILSSSAYCSLKDQYNKKIGRTIALGRLKQKIFHETGEKN